MCRFSTRLGSALLVAVLLHVRAATAKTYIGDVSTDRSMYSPGSNVTIFVNLEKTTATPFNGSVEVAVSHLGAVVANLPAQSVSLGSGGGVQVFSWIPPATDFQGYLVGVSLKNGSGTVLDSRSTAIDVSSDWKRFPRYGYVSHFDVGMDAGNIAPCCVTTV